MARYETVIFDLDGTLLDTLEDLADSANYALEKFGFAARTYDEIRSFVGDGVRKLIERAVSGQSEPQGQLEHMQKQLDQIQTAFRERYYENFNNKTRPYAGMESLLHRLKAEGVKMAIVSNKPDAVVKKLCEKYFADTIDVAVGEIAGIPRKPAPDMVAAALAQLRPSGKAVYVGDSETDIRTAQNACMDCISVSWGFRSRQTLISSGAQATVDNAEELEALLFQN